MDHEPEIEFEINPKPAALKRLRLSEEEIVDLVAEGLERYLAELGQAPQDERVPSYLEHRIQVQGQSMRLADLADIQISGGSELPPSDV